MSLYTRIGDGGETRLPGGDKVGKTDARIRTCGELDEFSAVVGVALAVGQDERLADVLATSQSILFEIGAWVAAIGMPGPRRIPQGLASEIERLEREIDELQAELPELRNFILPGGCQAGAILHLARTVCRGAERTLVELREAYLDATEFETVLPWINRMGDWLFAAARWANHKAGSPETLWPLQARSASE